jgi:uncharacterized protein (TIGR02145 family)
MKQPLKSLALLVGIALTLATLTACGDEYPSVQIGQQVWMEKNLALPPRLGQSSCYANDPANCEKYGRLYDFEGANNACPNGWHLPSNGEWKALANFIANSSDSLVAVKLKAKTGWENYRGEDGNGIDEYRFSALPNGYRRGTGYSKMGHRGALWTRDGVVEIDHDVDVMKYRSEYSELGAGVRCLKD